MRTVGRGQLCKVTQPDPQQRVDKPDGGCGGCAQRTAEQVGGAAASLAGGGGRAVETPLLPPQF